MLNFQTHSWRELWITLIIQQAEYQTNQGPQWDLCLNFFNKNIFSFCTCRFPHQYHFPRQITVCKILYWKGLLCPQWALAKNTFPVFSPPQEHPYRLSTLRIKSRIQYYATKNQRRKTIPENNIQFLLWNSVRCCPSRIPQKFRNREHQNILGGKECM